MGQNQRTGSCHTEDQNAETEEEAEEEEERRRMEKEKGQEPRWKYVGGRRWTRWRTPT